MKKIVFVLAILVMGLQSNVQALDCLDEYKPVCGNDGLTYRNSCYMLNYNDDAWAWVNTIGIAYHGECVDLRSCESFFDGCNTCSVQDGKISGCTKMACVTQEKPYCIKNTVVSVTESVDTETFQWEISDALKANVDTIWSTIISMLSDKTEEQKNWIYTILEQKIGEKISAMKDFQMRATFTPEASKIFQQKLNMFEYLYYLIKKA